MRGARSHPARTWTSFAACGLVAALCAALPLLGGRPPIGLEVAAVLAASLALGLMLGAGTRFPPAGVPLLALPAVSLLQLVPLPPTWIARLSPGTHRLLEQSLGPLAAYPAARPLSLDPLATARGLVLSVGFVAVFWIASSCAGTGRRRRLVLVGLGGGAGVVVVAALLGALLGWTRLLAPTFPLVDPNHLAGYLDLTLFAALALSLEAASERRLLWLLVVALAVTFAFLSLSRGGMAALFVGLALYWLASPRRRATARAADGVTARRAIPAALALGVVAALYLGVTPIAEELRTIGAAPTESKVRLWAPAVDMIEDYPFTGVGRGAFGTSFPAYKRDDAPVTYTHLENEWLQMVVELGVPGGGLLLFGISAILIAAWRRGPGSRTDAALLAGAAAFTLHEIGDFSLEVPACLFAFAAVLGLLTRERDPLPDRPAGAVARMAGLVAALGVGGAVLLLGRGIAAEALAAHREPGPAVAWAVRAATWSPADYLPQVTAGERLAAAGRCQEAMPWLARAAALGPSFPGTHRLQAGCLLTLGRPAEAVREYRLAVGFHDPAALPEAVRRIASVDALLAIADDTPEGLLELGRLLLPRDPAAARVVFARAWDDYVEPEALVPLAEAALAAGAPEEALRTARLREPIVPPDGRAFRAAALALERLGRADEARAEAERGLVAVPGSFALLGYLSDRARAAGRCSEAIRLAESITPASPAESAEREFMVARALRDQGRLGEAVRRAESGAAILPEQAGPEVFLASLQERAGRLDEAVRHLERAAALGGAERFRDRLEALRAAASAAAAARRPRGLESPGDPLPPAPGP